MDTLIQQGKITYVGSSNFAGWHIVRANEAAARLHTLGLVSEQSHYNLLVRTVELEVLPACREYGVGVIPWSPLARGRLTRDWDIETARTETDEFGGSLYRDEDRAVVETVAKVAARRGVPRAQVALAWLLAQPVVTSPIIGVTKPQHLTDAVAAVDLELSADEIEELGAGYTPHAIAGHR